MLKFFGKKQSDTDTPKKQKSPAREWFDSIIFALVAATIIRGLFIEPFTIPTSSMEKSLLAGDFLFVSKFHYGARTPRTPIQFPLAHQYFWGTNIKSYFGGLQLPVYRLPGLSDVERGDAVVFNLPVDNDHEPVDQKTHYIKRCVAVAGDTLSVVNAQVYINGEAQENPEMLQLSHRVYFDASSAPSERFYKKYDITDRVFVGNGYFESFLPDEAVEEIAKLPFIKEVQPLIMPETFVDPGTFPNDPEIFPWNRDFYGPIVIPSPGLTIELNDSTISLYQSTIDYYEGHDEVLVEGSQLRIDGELVSTYTFTNTYYFMMGDNRHNSEDSRFWGFVPEDHVVGKALFIWWSNNPQDGVFDGIRWDRVFSGID